MPRCSRNHHFCSVPLGFSYLWSKPRFSLLEFVPANSISEYVGIIYLNSNGFKREYFNFLLEYNFFTRLCQFLLYDEVNQLYVYIPFLLDLLPTSIPPPRSSQSTKLSSLCYTIASQQLSILHMVVYTCQSQSPHLSHPPLLPCVHRSILYICVSISALEICSSAIARYFKVLSLISLIRLFKSMRSL